MLQSPLRTANRTVTFKVSDYIGDQLHEHYLAERTADIMRPRTHFTDYKRLRHALNYIKTRQQRKTIRSDRIATQPDDRPITVCF